MKGLRRDTWRRWAFRVCWRELRGEAARVGWWRALGALARLLLGLRPPCPEGPMCPARSACEAGTFRCRRDGPYW